MQFRDLKIQYTNLKEPIDEAIQSVINKSDFISGASVKELEEALAQFVGVRNCITCGNGTDALSMVLMAWGIKEGDAIFVPDFTFFATAEVVAFQKATPIFIDVDENTFNMDPQKLEEAIQAVLDENVLTPKAIIPVDLFGLPADYPAIQKIAQKYQLLILEDGAQGFGGAIGDKRACSFGDAATTSFFPAKPLGCYGDGGAIFTNDDSMAEYLRSICVHGKGSFKYDNIRIGWNSRLDTLQAAILLVKFKAFKNCELDAVARAAHKYEEYLRDIVKIPYTPNTMKSSWAQYTIQLESEEQRNGLQNSLRALQIPSMVYYPKPLHRQKAFSDIRIYQECSSSEKLSKTVLSLPMHPYLTTSDIEFISLAIKDSLLPITGR